MKIRLLILLLSVCSSVIFGQRHTISGYIQNAETGEKLIGANIYTENNLAGTASNNYGFFSLTLEEGSYEILFSYVGYQTDKRHFELTEDWELIISLAVCCRQSVTAEFLYAMPGFHNHTGFGEFA